jgi:hypothetical protein
MSDKLLVVLSAVFCAVGLVAWSKALANQASDETGRRYVDKPARSGKGASKAHQRRGSGTSVHADLEQFASEAPPERHVTRPSPVVRQ